MSGGSFEYAFRVFDIHELMEKIGYWRDLRDAFEAEGFDDIAAEIDALLVQVDLAERRVGARLDRLREAAKAMEWWKSGDWSRDAVELAAANLRGET